MGSGEARNQLRARFLRNLTESVSGSVETTIASLTWSRWLSPDTDLFARYSWWRTALRGEEALVQPILEAGVRHRFDDVPSLFPRGSGSIAGAVFADDDLDGVTDGRGIEGAEVELDGMKKIRTAVDGKFVFAGVPRGPHRVTARVPSHPEAYFTTPSRVEVTTGESVGFGVATTPARLIGRVQNDAGAAIANVGVTLTRESSTLHETSASDGTFGFSAPPGAWTLAVSGGSLPAGYAVGSAPPLPVTLDRAAPAEAVVVIRALRTRSRSPAPVQTARSTSMRWAGK